MSQKDPTYENPGPILSFEDALRATQTQTGCADTGKITDLLKLNSKFANDPGSLDLEELNTLLAASVDSAASRTRCECNAGVASHRSWCPCSPFYEPLG